MLTHLLQQAPASQEKQQRYQWEVIPGDPSRIACLPSVTHLLTIMCGALPTM